MTDPRIRTLALALHELSWRVARLGPHRAGLDPLPASELAVLRAIVDEPGLSVSDVAGAVAMRSSNVSAAVRALVDRGLVSKTPHHDDRRVSVLHPTAKARSDKRAIDDALSEGIAEVLAGLPADSVAHLLSATPGMRALTAALAGPAPRRAAQLPESEHLDNQPQMHWRTIVLSYAPDGLQSNMIHPDTAPFDGRPMQ